MWGYTIDGEYLVDVLLLVVLVVITQFLNMGLGLCGIPLVFHCFVGGMECRKYD